MLVLISLAALAGALVTLESNLPNKLYSQARYETREILGLQKNWNVPPGPDQASGREEKDCPPPMETTVLVIGGQSNAANVVPVLSRAGSRVTVWFDGRCFSAADPLLGGTASAGSLWVKLADQLAKELGHPVLLINGAVGGTQFADWLDDRSGYYRALTNRVAAATKAGYSPDLILWHQGETDAAAEHDMDELGQEIGLLLDRLLADIPESLIYFFQASRCIGSYRIDGVPEVIAVEQKAAGARDRVITGMNTDELGLNFRWDTCHFNSLGRDAIVDRVTPELLSILKEDAPD